MAKTDKKRKDNLSAVVGNLREELRQDLLGISESIEQLQGAEGSGSDRAAIANSLQALRQELRHDVNSLSQQIEQAQLEQAQSMLVTPEADTAELTNAFSSLRQELHQNVRGLAESIDQLKASAASSDQQEKSDSIAASIEAMRSELQDDTTRLAQRIEQAQLAQAARESVAPVVDTSEFSNSVQSLRGELKRDVQNLSQSIARNQPPPKTSPVLTTVAVLAALATGAFGMAFYQNRTERNSQSKELTALDAKLIALNSKVESLGQQDLEQLLEESRTKDAERDQEATNRLNDTIVGLQNALSGQDKQIEEGFTNITDRLASEVAKIAAKGVTTVAKPPVEATAGGDTPKEDAQPDEGEAEAGADATAQAEEGAGEKDSAAPDPAEEPLEKVEQNVVRSPAKAKLIIDNPSRFDFKLKINGQEVNVAARRVTTVPVTQGVVKTEIGSYSQEWDDWEVVDGEPRLKIEVESGNDYYKLLKGKVAVTSE